MQNKKALLIGIITSILIILSLLILFLIPKKYNSNYDVELLVKKGPDFSEINLNNSEKKKLIYYLDKEKLKENNGDDLLDCLVIGIYKIKYKDYEIDFDDEDCVTYLLDKKTGKYMQITISKNLKKYAIKVAKKGEK